MKSSARCGIEALLVMSLPWMKGSEGKCACQELAFIAIQRREIHVRASIITAPAVFRPEVVHFSGFCGEVSHRPCAARVRIFHWLPTGAKKMFSGSHGKIEIGIAMRGSHPAAIETGPNGGLEQRSMI